MAGALAERLREAFACSHNPRTGRPFTVPEVAQEVSGVMSQAYIYALRKGEYTEPSASKLKHLADVLGCTVDWLLGGDEVGEDEELSQALQQPAVRSVALRAARAELSPELADQVGEMMDILARRNGQEPQDG